MAKYLTTREKKDKRIQETINLIGKMSPEKHEIALDKALIAQDKFKLDHRRKK